MTVSVRNPRPGPLLDSAKVRVTMRIVYASPLPTAQLLLS